MAAVVDKFAVLNEVNSEVDVSVIPNVSSKKPKGSKKGTKKNSKTGKDNTLRDNITALENDNPVCAILYNYDGKDQFSISDFKFSSIFYNELEARNIKNPTVSDIQDVINGRRTRPKNKVIVWFSYFEKETLKKLTEQENFTTPSEFESTFNLVRGGPITVLKFSYAIIFDFRSFKNSKKSFMYLSNGKPVHFGTAYDDYRIDMNRDKLVKLKNQYEESLKLFDDVYDTCNKIFSLTDDPKDRNFVDEAEYFITKYARIHHSDEQIELRRLLQYKGWENDLKIECDRALKYHKGLFDLLETLRELDDRKKSFKLEDKEQYPSL